MKKHFIIRVCGLIVAVCLMAALPVLAADDNAGKINLNTATKEQLMGIGLDADLADRILELRKENGEFVDIEELTDIDGIDAKTMRQLKRKIYIEAAKGCNC